MAGEEQREPGRDGPEPPGEAGPGPAAPYGGPPPYAGPPPSGMRPPSRPRQVTAAAVLWIILGALSALAGLGQIGRGGALLDDLYYQPLTVGFPLIVSVLGVVMIVLGVRMLSGSDGARTALTVVGSITLISVWTLLFVVPALILQYRPGSNAWFRAVNAPRFPPPRPPMPPPPAP